MRRIRVLALLLAAAASRAVAADEAVFHTLEDGFGPLMVRSESPVQALRLTPMPRAPILPAPGDHELRVMANTSSIWGKGPGYFLDLELADYRLALLTGLPRNWGLELALNERRVVKGNLDGFIIAFHDAFGIDQNGRDEAPLNDTRVSFPEYGIEMGSDKLRAFSRAVEATVVKKLSTQEGGRPALAVSASVRYETLENGPLPKGSTDYSVEFNLGKRLGRSFLYASLGYSRFGSDSFLAIPLHDEQVTGMFAYEWRTDVKEAFIIQYLYGEGVAVGLGELSEPSHEIIFGYKWLVDRMVWEFAFTENIINFENSPDFGVTLALSHRF